MIPVELTLRNFLSYGDDETTLDFRRLRTACLSGENGHGKSALLDAITWALWGETRLGKQGHEHLIRIGADEMAVVFTFRVGGDEYRVRRQRGKRSGGQIWELQQADGNGGWRPLTGTNASDTGRIIQQLLRMSYDTFLNSAYLKQGRADEFVRQTSNKRKEILCEILELSRYDILEDKAKQRAKIAADTAFEAQRQINGIEAILAEEERFLTEMQLVEKELSELTAERENLDKDIQIFTQSLAVLGQQRERAKHVRQDLYTLETQLKEASMDRAEHLRNLDSAQMLLADAAMIERDYRSLLAARALGEQLRVKVLEYHSTDRNRYVLQNELRETEREMLDGLRGLEDRVADAQLKSTQALPLRQKLVDLERERERYEGLDDRRRKIQSQADDDLAERGRLKYENDGYEHQIQEIHARIDRLHQQTEACSVCGNPLPTDKIDDLIAECDTQIAEVKGRQNGVRQEAARIKTRIQKSQSELSECEIASKAANNIAVEIARCTQQLRGLDEQIQHLPKWEIDRAALALCLDRKDYAHEARTRLAELDARYRELSRYVAEEESNLRILTDLARADEHYLMLQKAQETLVLERKALTALERIEGDMNRRRATLLAEQGEFFDVEPRFDQTAMRVQEIQRRQQDVVQRFSRADQYRGKLCQSLDDCTKQRAAYAAQVKERDLARKEEYAYKQLAGAFGKRGVQADIIENALPELQNYANELLDRLTDGDMSVHIDTQRQSKTKGAALIETLEIQISDSLGTRALEMYSGGESFRVSFALRIALSKLLARRAGADLQTLIVDEGFGTQDAKGREKLIDAVTAIQPDFEKILVITHIDEMKDAFPSRIEVVKTASGSQISVLHGDSIG